MSLISSGKQAPQEVRGPLFFLEGFPSAAARSLKENFSPLGLLLLYGFGNYVHIQVILYIGISDGLNQDLWTQVWSDAALPGEQQ